MPGSNLLCGSNLGPPFPLRGKAAHSCYQTQLEAPIKRPFAESQPKLTHESRLTCNSNCRVRKRPFQDVPRSFQARYVNTDEKLFTPGSALHTLYCVPSGELRSFLIPLASHGTSGPKVFYPPPHVAVKATSIIKVALLGPFLLGRKGHRWYLLFIAYPPLDPDCAEPTRWGLRVPSVHWNLRHTLPSGIEGPYHDGFYAPIFL